MNTPTSPFDPMDKPAPRVDIIKGTPPKTPGPGVFHERRVMVDGECRGYWTRAEWRRGTIYLVDLYRALVLFRPHDDDILRAATIHTADEDLMLRRTYEVLEQGALPSPAEQEAKRQEQDRTEGRLARLHTHAESMHELLAYVVSPSLDPTEFMRWRARVKAVLRNIDPEDDTDSNKDNES